MKMKGQMLTGTQLSQIIESPIQKSKHKDKKVPDDEDIDIDKIVKGDKPKDDRKSATEIERQSREKEAKKTSARKVQKNTNTKRYERQRSKKDLH